MDLHPVPEGFIDNHGYVFVFYCVYKVNRGGHQQFLEIASTGIVWAIPLRAWTSWGHTTNVNILTVINLGGGDLSFHSSRGNSELE
jgi:hypothetical protein